MTREEIVKALRCCNSETECRGCTFEEQEPLLGPCAEKVLSAAADMLEQDAKKTNWISVKDRVPNPSTYVLALTAPGALSVGQNVIVADYIHPKSEDHGVFVIAYTNYDDKNIVPVTHWMPLPDIEGIEDET